MRIVVQGISLVSKLYYIVIIRRVLSRVSKDFSRTPTPLFFKINAKMFYLIFSRFRGKMICSPRAPAKL